MCGISGKQVLSGPQETSWNSDPEVDTNWHVTKACKHPACLGFDFLYPNGAQLAPLPIGMPVGSRWPATTWVLLPTFHHTRNRAELEVAGDGEQLIRASVTWISEFAWCFRQCDCPSSSPSLQQQEIRGRHKAMVPRWGCLARIQAATVEVEQPRRTPSRLATAASQSTGCIARRRHISKLTIAMEVISIS